VVSDLILYRALHPAWSFAPLSGKGASIKGGRWNRKNAPALYLAIDPMTALAEYNQDLEFHPVTLGAFAVSGARLANLCDDQALTALGIDKSIHNEPWFLSAVQGNDPPQWAICDRLAAQGVHGVIYPSAQSPLGKCVALWCWNGGNGPNVSVSDSDNRLPLDQSSWQV